MYHVSAQGVDERMINVHYSYKMLDHSSGHSTALGLLKSRNITGIGD